MKERLLADIGKKLGIDTHFVARSGFWLLLGHLVGVLSALAVSYAAANYLTPATYGQYKYLITVGILISSFSLTGTATAIVQATAKNVGGFYKYIKRINLHYSLAISALAIIGAIYYFVNDNKLLSFGLIIISILQPLFNNTSLFYSYLQGKERYDLSTYAHGIKAIFTTIVFVTATLLTEDVLILLTSYFLSYILINYALQYFFIKQRETSNDAEKFSSLLTYTKHTSVQNVLSGIAGHIDKILVFQNLGAVELAVYTFATVLPDQYKGITKTVDTMLLPRFSKHSPASVKSRIFHKTAIYFLFLLSAVAIYIFAAPYIFYFFFPQYAESIFLSQIYVVGMIFGIGSIPLAAIKSEMSNQKLYRFNFLTSLLQILITLVTIPLFGLLGAVFARITYRFFGCFYAYYLYFKS